VRSHDLTLAPPAAAQKAARKAATPALRGRLRPVSRVRS
jgi:hypothetical protein